MDIINRCRNFTNIFKHGNFKWKFKRKNRGYCENRCRCRWCCWFTNISWLFGNSVGACAAAGTYGAAICATPSTAIAAGVAALSWPVAIGATVVAGVGLNMVRKIVICVG